jgi:hypothetical protein
LILGLLDHRQRQDEYLRRLRVAQADRRHPRTSPTAARLALLEDRKTRSGIIRNSFSPFHVFYKTRVLLARLILFKLMLVKWVWIVTYVIQFLANFKLVKFFILVFCSNHFVTKRTNVPRLALQLGLASNVQNQGSEGNVFNA